MKFKTASGTEYLLTDIETGIMATGESCPSVGPQGIPVIIKYTGNLSRIGAPLRDLVTGGHIETIGESQPIEFFRMPEIGNRFVYNHPVWAGCYSTPIIELEEWE